MHDLANDVSPIYIIAVSYMLRSLCSLCLLLLIIESLLAGQTYQRRNTNRNPPPYPEETLAHMQLPPNLTAEQLFTLGGRLDQAKRYRAEAAVFLKCAGMGNPRCMSALGMMYDQSIGVPHDLMRAVWYLTRAASLGNRGAEYQIGEYFEEGAILPKDMSKAMYWYRKSADAGMPQAERRMGLAYELAETVPHDRGQAIRWLAKAAAQGDGLSADLVQVLRNPRTPARFRDMEALGNYYHGLYAQAYQQMMSQFGGGGASDGLRGAQAATAMRYSQGYGRALSTPIPPWNSTH